MKRNEVVKMIASKLERCHDRYGNLHNFELVAHELLEDIEEVGIITWEPEDEEE